MSSDHIQQTPEEGRVIPFRPRRQAPQGWRWPLRPARHSPVKDLSKYEEGGAEDDYRHRMKMNVLGLAVIVLLMATGAWLVTTLAEIRKNQDCYLSGQRNCAPIKYTPSR